MRCPRRLVFAGALAASLAACSGGSDPPTAIELAVARLEFTQECLFLSTGARCTLAVRAFTEDGQQIANPVLRWASSNSSSVRIVDEDGTTAEVEGVAAGSSTITVSNSTGTVFVRTEVRVAGPSK